ncbi:MAG: hypothetical protein U9N10_06315 [Bacillota bacterium]|nr:hypothetical protein [Bacillota bacterium]
MTLVMVISISLVGFAGTEKNFDLEDNNKIKIFSENTSQRIYFDDSIDKNNFTKSGSGYVDLTYYITPIFSTNTYQLYLQVSGTDLTNYVKGTYSVTSTSILFPKEYMSPKYISKSYTTSTLSNIYLATFSAPSEEDKIKLVTKGVKVYDISRAMWIDFGNWSGAFVLE